MSQAKVQSNIDTIKSVYAAFGKGDAAAIVACLREDVEWELGYAHNDDIPWLKSGRGHAHVAQFLTALQCFDFKKFDIMAVMGDGDWVVALVALELAHRQSGRTLSEACEPHVWRFDSSGKVVSMRHAADTRTHARVAGVDP